MTVTIIIPCYNEFNTIEKLLKKILSLKNLKPQIIIVDDGSTDRTTLILKKKVFSKSKVIYHKKNKGKGAAINTAKKYIKSDVVIIQDADLEYDPRDYKKIVQPIFDGKFKVVYGSRFLKKEKNLRYYFNSYFQILGNLFLTFISNLLNNQNLTDAHTCYKAFDSKIFKNIILKESGFSFCPEITTKVSKMSLRIHEVAIKYKSRNVKEGKKIRLFDGLHALYCLIKYRFFI
jgi:glycosyltransferase involved in cell wall biosynthesis